MRLLDLLHQTITELAELRPVLLVVEDLHWADRSTRDLVAYLVAILTYEPVLVVATFRNDTPGATPDLDVALAELRRHQKVTALELAPLPRDVLAELVAEWAPGRSDLEELVWQRSAGNAFIAEETVRAVLGGDAHGLPPTLREVVLSRIAVLSADGQQVVRAHRGRRGPAAAPAARRRARAARGHAAWRRCGRRWRTASSWSTRAARATGCGTA